MSAAVYFHPTARKELEEAGRHYGSGLVGELSEWLSRVCDSVSRDEAPREASGSDPSHTRSLRLVRTWWKPSDPSLGNAIRGSLYALRRRAAPYEIWLTERQFPVIGVRDIALVLRAMLLVDRVRGRVEVTNIDYLTPGSPPATEVGNGAWKGLTAERVRLIDKKYDTGLDATEAAELDRLQRLGSEALDRDFPAPRLSPEDLESVRRALAADDRGRQ